MDIVHIKRLAFIKYLFTVGVDQSKMQEPLSSSSILLFHDAVELFLQLSSEYLNVRKNKIEFMEYWDIIVPQLSGNELFQKESMRRMNKARVSLKHHGTFSSSLDIEGFINSTTEFFHQNTPLIFGIQFSEINLVDFIEPDTARNLLKEVEPLLLRNNKYEAIKNISIAFEIVLDHYENKAIDKYGKSPFDFGSGFTNRSRPAMYSHYYGSGNTQPDMLVLDALESLSSAVKVLSLNLDYRKYSKYRIISLHINKTVGGSYHVIPQNDLEKINNKSIDELFILEDITFCYNFVIETGLVINSFYKYL